ncbi:PAAR domain-containing protein [Chimaeribacter arupi]|uniref:PAAR domain-containing protein n=1 Tax=Chimaeribacter arupi TaxID=2060066 RepID=UPI000C7CD10E|nr:PAAR domain-containing protein [Chimaeribacter arupi]PLR43902.1 PAAR domain-containing protein [Chimaeribacter arupi]PLR52321.1 PAAR domain-containing protein [Chimaeribacter arupi]WKZ93513.1 PAAR domain-containing protein [Chimaeribacter arupi]
MPTKKLAALGDKTTYGSIISATSAFVDEGRVIAQSGDLASCSKCKGAFPINGTAEAWIDEGTKLVQDQDRVLCGCNDHNVFAQTKYFNG